NGFEPASCASSKRSPSWHTLASSLTTYLRGSFHGPKYTSNATSLGPNVISPWSSASSLGLSPDSSAADSSAADSSAADSSAADSSNGVSLSDTEPVAELSVRSPESSTTESSAGRSITDSSSFPSLLILPWSVSCVASFLRTTATGINCGPKVQAL
ncbi:hypothetical protein GNI_190590, partial [Gregarina niphandrodes]